MKDQSGYSYLQKLNSIAMLDPGIATRNVGDEIIAHAARAELESLFPDHFLATVPTHEGLGPRSYRLIGQSDAAIVAGSNILSGHLLTDRQWRVRPWDAFFVKNLVLLAVGWRSYTAKNGPLSVRMLKSLISDKFIHSVRDEHTRKKMQELGIDNVVNTACVTMWRLDLEKLKQLPAARSRSVVTTINAGDAHPEKDKRIAEALLSRYDEVYAWVQGIDDANYIQQTFAGKAKIVAPQLSKYDALLRDHPSLDYFGHRLHGGIRALQHNRRATIVSIDNRATEITRDTRLPVIERDAPIDQIIAALENPAAIDIRLPEKEIETWRSQFASIGSRAS